MENVHALTVRLPGPIYKAAKRLARMEGVSVNVLVQGAIEEKASRSASTRLSKAYEVLASDAAEAGVESLLAAQVDALLNE